MNKHPLSITIISWLLILSSAGIVYTAILSVTNPEIEAAMKLSRIPIVVQYLFMLANIVIYALSGYLMLKGKVLGRLIYFIFGVFGIFINLVISPNVNDLLLNGFVFAIFMFCLHRPKANEYFGKI